MSSESDNQHNINSQPRNLDSWLSLEVYVQANHPELLNGLDRWLELGLINEAQIIKICRQNLSCALPEIETVAAAKIEAPEGDSAAEQELVKAVQPSVINRLWQGFLDELSIRWLLFLGIFLVVVSSGVLAASQWNNFPTFGQYLILLIYTLGFWGIGFWSSKQGNLKLTSQTLSAIAILLVPINCWAINHFSLGNSILEWITLIVSLVILTSVVYEQSKLSLKYNNRLFASLFLFLSYLHLVWQLIPSPLIAVYGGIITISLIHYIFLLPKKKYPVFNLLFLLSAWSLILVRIVISQDFLMLDCASAIALFGWILASIYLTKERQAQNNNLGEQSEIEQLTNAFLSKVLQVISIIVFIAMWSISLLGGILESPLYFWQTVAISALAIHLFSQRLTLYWRKRDITAIFLIGLQTVFISKELIPDSLRRNALDLAVNLSQTAHLPESVFGVTLFPYTVLFIFIASWLYRQQKHGLGQYTEILTLLLGIGLTYLSLSNPTWRSLNLLFSTMALSYVAWIRQPVRISLVQFTHLLGLVTIVNAIDVIAPNLSQPVWGCILVSLMGVEWLIYSRYPQKYERSLWSIFRQSCWYLGLLLAATSYVCFASYVAHDYSATPMTFAWGLVWFVTPAILTWIAKHTRSMNIRRTATILSCVALIMAQVLVIGQPVVRAIGLSIAIGLMYFNAFGVRRTWITAIHLGFGLSLFISLLNSFTRNANWLVVGAILILGLYQFRLYLKEMVESPKFSYISQRTAFGILGVGMETRNYKLIDKYIQAADYWAIALATIVTAILSVAYANIADFNYYLQYILTTVLILAAVVWRYQKQPNDLVLYTLVWLVELLTIGVVALFGGGNLSFAVINIVLGLFTWGIGQRVSNGSTTWAKLNLAYIPLVYAALAMLWRMSLYNAYTGLITLGAAFVLINTKESNRQINRLTSYLGFIAVSLGIYEIVIYKMQQSSGGSLADGLTILALVAAAIAFCYRLGVWWYRQRQHQTIFNLSLSKVVLVAHIHWAISSILKIIAASIAIESKTPRLTPLSIATSFCLGAYAVIQGKDRDTENTSSTNDWWVYIGLVEIAATLVYSRLIINKLSFFDPWRVIFTCAIALIIYQIPWHNFGWRVTPWQRAAIVTPALMALVTAEEISYLSLFFTAIFYLRIAYHQKNLRWSYVSLGFINWGIIRLVWQFNTELIWLAGIVSLSILYVAQFDAYFISQRRQRHFVRLIGCSILCVVALFYQDPGIIPGVVSFSLIFLGLGLKIRALLFSGTITLILTVVYQVITLVVAYAFLKWVVGLLAGILSIVVAAGFEKNRDRLQNKLHNYNKKLQDWQ